MTLKLTPLNALVESVLQDIKAEFPGRDVVWQIDAVPGMNCDPGLVRQVFANLLSNAVKFTRDRKPAMVQVGHMVVENESVIFVRDNGIGFDPKFTSKLFGIFVRLHHTKDFEGSGVGLATVQRIVQKHGGRIWVEAQPDKGATFYFTLQKAESQTREPDYAVAPNAT